MAGLSEFALDFGISISKSTLMNVAKLGASLKACNDLIKAGIGVAEEENRLLRDNVLRLGSFANAMDEINNARKRMISGKSFFGLEDQMKGMETLRRMGLDAQKNFEFINKAAHATGKSFADFSNVIASAIGGNARALSDAGLMTERATRMFEKYKANTVQRQQAILNFMKSHKGLLSAIKNDFQTVSDYAVRISGSISDALSKLVGRPDDPNTLYGSTVRFFKRFSELFVSFAERAKKYFWSAGQVLGWFVRQAGHFMDWVARKIKPHIDAMWGLTENYKEQTRSFIVWLEFWKVRIVNFFREYQKEIKTALVIAGAFLAINWVSGSLVRLFGILSGAVGKLRVLRKAQHGASIAFRNLGNFGSKIWARVASLFVYLPKPLQKVFIWVVRIVSKILTIKGIVITALVAIFAYLYNKSEKYRGWVNTWFKAIKEGVKFIVNIILLIGQTIAYVARCMWEEWIKPGFEKLSNFLTDLFSEDSRLMKAIRAVGDFLTEWIVEPITKVLSWIGGKLSSANEWLSGANKTMAGMVTEGNPNANNTWTNVAGGLSGSDFNKVDYTNYGRKAVDTVKNTYNKNFGDTKNITINNNTTNNFEGGIPSDEQLDALTFKLSEVQRRNNRQLELQMGK